MRFAVTTNMEGTPMSAFARIVKFGLGGAIGAAAGGAAAFVFAPQSGDELTGKIKSRLADARLAGAEAKAAKERELIGRFRAKVQDPTALQADEMAVQAAVSDAAQEAAMARVGR